MPLVSKAFVRLLIIAVFLPELYSQVITTITGTDFLFPRRPLPALNAPLGPFAQLAFDSAGNLYIASNANSVVLKMDPAGELSVAAGNGILGKSGDGGPATRASIGVSTIAIDSTGSLYIGSSDSIRKVAPDGTIDTFFQGCSSRIDRFYGGCPAGLPVLDIGTLAVDAAGNVLVGDPYGRRVYRLTPAGALSVFAGNGLANAAGDGGPATGASLGGIRGITVDSRDNVLIYEFDRIRRVDPNGTISTLAIVSDSPSVAAIVADRHDNILVTTTSVRFVEGQVEERDSVSRINGDGSFTLIAGGSPRGFSGDGHAAEDAALNRPSSLAVSASGDLFIADSGSQRIRKVDSADIISTVAGDGSFRFAGDGGPAIRASLNRPSGLAIDNSDNLVIADSENHRIRAIDRNGVIDTIAGNGNPTYNGDGILARNASLQFPSGVAIDATNNLLIADTTNGRIRRVSPSGMISTVAGDGFSYETAAGFPPREGEPAVTAPLNGPRTVAAAPDGGFFIGDTGNRLVRRVALNGTITTVAGNGMTGFSGDGGPATQASLDYPGGLLALPDGRLLIVDVRNDRIRAVTPGGSINTIAGGSASDDLGDGGPATEARLLFGGGSVPGLTIDKDGNLYFVDAAHGRIRKVTPGGIISTVAGNGGNESSGDGGLATEASVAFPADVAVDSEGNLYIAEQDLFGSYGKIRKVLAAPPAFAVSPLTTSCSGSSGGAPSDPQPVTLSGGVAGLSFTASSDTHDTGDWLSVSVLSGVTPRVIEVACDPTALAPGAYEGTITLQSPNAAPPVTNINVTFSVGPAKPPSLQADRPSISFLVPTGATRQKQSLILTNSGGGTLDFMASVSNPAFSVTPASGTLHSSQPLSLSVTADSRGLPFGSYSGELTIVAGNGEVRRIILTLSVSSNPDAILLSQSGLTFVAVEKGGIVPGQSFSVLSAGANPVSYSVSATTLSGGDWLSATAASGAASPAAPSQVSVNVNAKGLPAGAYFGQVRVDARSAANSPQIVTVFLRVLPAGTEPGATISPSELAFASPQDVNPSSAEIYIYDIGATPVTYTVAVANTREPTVVVVPKTGIVEPDTPAIVIVQPTSLTTPGAYDLPLTFQFSDGRVRTVKTTIVVRPPAERGAVRHAGGCTPTSLLPALTTIGPQFQVPAASPTALVAQIQDNCGNPLDAGSVSVRFSNGDPPLSLFPIGRGQWSATWQSMSSTNRPITITLTATDTTTLLRGTREVSGSSFGNQDPPLLDSASIVSSATPRSYVPLAPGSLFTIYGSRLADSTETFTSDPLPTKLGDTEVAVGGQFVPLLYASPNQINAIIPYGISVNTTLQVLVQRGLTYSVPVAVDAAAAQPGVFAIQAYRDGDPAFTVSSGHPAKAGDVLVLYCAGLGLTDQMVPDGGVAPQSPLAVTNNPVSVLFGETEAPVSFAGLAPGFVGLYQVNTQVPAGVPPGDAVKVTMSVAGQNLDFTVPVQ